MSISLAGSAEANATSITLPTHQVNDLILIFAYNDGSTTPPTLPTGFASCLATAMGSSGYLLTGYKVAASSSETSGTWTNADHLIALVFRGGASSIVMPEAFASNSATSTTVTFGAQLTGSYRTDAIDVAVVGFVAQRNTTNNLAQAPGAMVNILTGGDGSAYQVAANWDDARATAWTSSSITVATSALYRTQVLGLFEQAFTSTGGGVPTPLDHPLVR